MYIAYLTMWTEGVVVNHVSSDRFYTDYEGGFKSSLRELVETPTFELIEITHSEERARELNSALYELSNNEVKEKIVDTLMVIYKKNPKFAWKEIEKIYGDYLLQFIGEGWSKLAGDKNHINNLEVYTQWASDIIGFLRKYPISVLQCLPYAKVGFLPILN